MIQRIFNIISIGALSLLILSITGFFFIGSTETFDKQLMELPEYFLKRTAGGIVVGLLGCVIILIVNIFFNRMTTVADKPSLKRIALATLLFSVISSIIGTAIFFNH
jgi:uncharacterized membrane protein required for colicin V production